MGIGLRALVLATCLMASPAFAADQQFDLICTSPTGNAHYRVDLDKHEACVDDCGETWKLPEASSTRLSLIDTRPAYPGDHAGIEESSVVNRVTGAWSYHLKAAGKFWTRNGACRTAAFSGFPATKF